ncbi:MAG: biotin--[acetyl-CoA-carboxylase] ligase [Sedimentisphaerales bacterium]
MNRTISSPDSLDPDRIKSHLKTRRIGKKVVVYTSTSSTNDVAAQYAKNKNNDGLVVLAEEQTSGRGRSGARWVSAPGKNILCSILWFDKLTIPGKVEGLTDCSLDAELLSLTIAVAVAEAIGKCAKTEAKIKWPNDVIVNNKKIAGILIESVTSCKYSTYVIGVGINCHQRKDDFSAELQKTATSIDIETGTGADRISLIKRLLVSVEHWLDVVEKKPQKVIERWQKLSTQLNHRIALVYNRKRYVGNCIGVHPRDGLVLHLDTGGIRMFHAAQTTIAKE